MYRFCWLILYNKGIMFRQKEKSRKLSINAIFSIFSYFEDHLLRPVAMVSRRKILSRSRDDLNLDNDSFRPGAVEEEDVWYAKEKLYKVNALLLGPLMYLIIFWWWKNLYQANAIISGPLMYFFNFGGDNSILAILDYAVLFLNCWTCLILILYKHKCFLCLVKC